MLQSVYIGVKPLGLIHQSELRSSPFSRKKVPFTCENYWMEWND